MAESFDTVLEQCLDQIRTGKSTIWNCLARYPDLAHELEPLLLSAEGMWTVPKPALSAEARARIDARVFGAVNASEQRQPVAAQAPTLLRRRGWAPVWRWAGMGLALLLVSFLSLTVVANAVGKTLPGSPLHPVKLAAEDTRLWLTPGRDKPKLQLVYARRRLEEVAALIERGEVDPSAVYAMTEETEAVLQGLAGLPPDAAVPLMTELVELISEQDRTLSSIVEGSQSQSRAQFESALQANAAQADRSRSLVSSLPMPPSIAVRAVANLDRVPEPEGDVEYTIQVVNDGSERVRVTGLTSELHGDLGGQGTCVLPPEGISLNPDESYVCAFGAVVAGNADNMQTDTVTVVAVDDDGFEARRSATTSVLIGDVVPVIRVSQSANPGSVPEPEGVTEFKVRITNDGPEMVTLAGLEDSERGNLKGWGTCTLPAETISIGPGGAYECAYRATVSGNAGTNRISTVTAIVTDDEGNTVQASASATVSIADQTPTIRVDKTATPSSVPEPGGSVRCTVRVTNLGDEALSLDALVDEVHGDLHGRGTCSLAPGEVTIPPRGTYECSFDARVTGNAGDSQQAVITAIVSDDEGNRAGASGSASVTIADVVPNLNVAITAQPDQVSEPGAMVHLLVRVDNRGPERVKLESLVDDIAGDLNGMGDCAIRPDVTAIDPGASYRCSYIAPIAGNANEKWSSTVTALAGDDEGNKAKAMASLTVPITDAVPVITVQKRVKPDRLREPGGPVQFAVEVLNQGVEEVRLLSLLDDLYGDLNGQGSCSLRPAPVRIPPGESYKCGFGIVVSGNAADRDESSVTAAVSDDEGNRTTASAGASVTIVDALPAITVSKTAKPAQVPEPGGNVGFAVRVTNSGSERVILNALMDDANGNLNGRGTCLLPQNGLAIEPHISYECSYTVAVAGNAGQVQRSSVTATVFDDEGNTVEAKGRATVTTIDVLPQVGVSLAASPNTAPETGETIRFRVRVTNKGFEPVRIQSLAAGSRAELDGRGSCEIPEEGIELGPQDPDAPGESYECTFSAKVSGNASEVVTERVLVGAIDDEGNEVQATASDKVTLTDVLPSIRVSQTVDPAAVPEPAGTARFTVRVTNDGLEQIGLDALADSSLGDLLDGRGICAAPQAGVDIRPGETYTCEYQAKVAGNAGESQARSVKALVSDDDGNRIEASAGSLVTVTDVLPTIKVSKVAEPSSLPEPGGRVTLTARTSNPGPEPVTLLALRDEVFGDLNGQGTCSLPQEGVPIPAGESYVCSFQAEIQGNPGVVETGRATAIVSDDEGNEAMGSAGATVMITDLLPVPTAGVTTNINSLPEPGGAVILTIRIANEGAEKLKLDSLVDDLQGGLLAQGICSKPPGGIMLDPGNSYECSYQVDITGNAGQNITHVITAVASDDEGNSAEVSASATISISDVIPELGADLSAAPGNVLAPGGEVALSLKVNNTGAETVTLGSMVDDVGGNLAGQGTCTSGLSGTAIGPGGFYECVYTAGITGNAGDSHFRSVTVVAFDDEGNRIVGTASVIIPIVQETDSSSGFVCQPGIGGNPECSGWSPVALVVSSNPNPFVPPRAELPRARIRGFIGDLGAPPVDLPT